MVGWNIEIMFMFAIAGLIYYHTLSEDPAERILGIPNRWFWAIAYSAFCVFVECGLNMGAAGLGISLADLDLFRGIVGKIRSESDVVICITTGGGAEEKRDIFK